MGRASSQALRSQRRAESTFWFSKIKECSGLLQTQASRGDYQPRGPAIESGKGQMQPTAQVCICIFFIYGNVAIC